MTTTIVKQLGGMEDLVCGVGTVTQTRNKASVTINKVDVPIAVGSEAELSALDVTKYTRARVYTSTVTYDEYIYDSTSVIGIASTGPGTWILANPTTVYTIEQLTALTPIKNGQVVTLSLGGRSGTFVWTLGDFTTQVANDTQQGIHIASSLVDVTVGCWVRQCKKHIINSSWFGAGNTESASTNDLAISAAVTMLPSTGGQVVLPDQEFQISQPLSDTGKTVEFFGMGSVIKPTVGCDGVHLFGQRSKLIVKSVDGSASANTGDGVICGYGGVITATMIYVDCLITNMPGNGLVWEHGPSLTTRVLCISNGGHGIYFTANYIDNNHGQIIAHCSSNGGWGAYIEGNADVALSSRHHHFILLKAYGNTAGGVYIDSRENTGNIFVEANTGDNFVLGSLSQANKLLLNGVYQTVDTYTDNGVGNVIEGEDNNNEWTSSRVQGKSFKLRDSTYIGGLIMKPTADRTFVESVSNTSGDTTVTHAHNNGGTLTHTFEALSIGSSATLAVKVFEKSGRGTCAFGAVPANGYSVATITVTGASVGDSCYAGIEAATIDSNLGWSAYVSATDTVTIVMHNSSTSASSDTTVVMRAVVTRWSDQ